MLYIIAQHNRDYSWHVGEPMPSPDVDQVVEIQADGHEKKVIREMFGESIPMTTESVVNWYGDIARTIYLNLANKY